MTLGGEQLESLSTTMVKSRRFDEGTADTAFQELKARRPDIALELVTCADG